MNAHAYSAQHIAALVLLIIVVLTGCTPTSVHNLYQPGSPEVHLWGPDSVSIDASWNYLDAANVSVIGQVRDLPLLAPLERAETLIFSRNTNAGTELLLIGRVIKGSDPNTFVYLGGDKQDVQGKIWRTATYGIEAAHADREMRVYLDLAAAKGCCVAPEYTVEILDRLPSDRVLLRTMHLVPGHSSTPLPEFGELYPQDRDEILRLRPGL